MADFSASSPERRREGEAGHSASASPPDDRNGQSSADNPFATDRPSAATRRMLEELADLFLTSGDAASAGPAADAAGGGQATQRATQPTAEPPAVEREEAAPRREGSTATCAIEAVVLGHLPGFASPWVAQYAHVLAEDRQADVAILTPEPGDRVRLDLVRAGDSPERPAPMALPGEGLADALAELAPRLGGCLVVVDDPHEHAGRRVLEQTPTWTVLSGADEAAVVGAYRLLKSMHAVARFERSRVVQVAFAGCDRATAEAALGRLGRAAEVHLNFDVKLATVRQRIEPARRHNLAVYDAGDDLVETIDAALAAPASSEAHGEPSPERASGVADWFRQVADRLQAGTSGPTANEPDAAASEPAPAAESAEAVAETSPRAAADSPREPGRFGPRPVHLPSFASLVKAVEGASADASPSVDSTVAGGDAAADDDILRAPSPPLWPYLGDGVAPLTARCPRCRAVQFALDAEGRLHLLRQVDVDGTAEASICELVEGRAWAIEHATLLGGNETQWRVDPALEPRLHLFTAAPAPLLPGLAHALTGPDASPITLHLRKPVDLHGVRTYLHARLT